MSIYEVEIRLSRRNGKAIYRRHKYEASAIEDVIEMAYNDAEAIGNADFSEITRIIKVSLQNERMCNDERGK